MSDTGRVLAMSPIRTRFAPSPTGYLHVGGARTALFNWLFARKNEGVFILRIEDTDRERSTPEAVEAILDGMNWLGLNWDEGPFYQSERSEIYQKYGKQLLDKGKAYEAERATYFRSISDKVEDFVIMKSDGMPTYHFAVVIDDWLMGITHVIRGDDHVSNTPKHVMLYEALGAPKPKFVHVPMILGSDGQRLSKRHGATSVLAYRDQGYLPEAMINYLARLGWAHGDQEIFRADELIEKFSLNKLGKSAGIFDPQKLVWLNGHYIQQAAPDRLCQILCDYFQCELDQNEQILKILDLLKPRAKVLPDLIDGLKYFLADNISYDMAAVQEHLTSPAIQSLTELTAHLEELHNWTKTTLESLIRDFSEKKGLKAAHIIHPLRVAITGRSASPGIFDTLELIGREKVLYRLNHLPDC